MLFPDAQLRVWLYGEPVDMRKSYDGLYALEVAHTISEKLNFAVASLQ